ncbi:MAG TPA: SDR family oxidoreductase [Rhizobiaceae bacterium]
MSSRLLVTGASGKLGRGVIGHLIADQKVAPKDIIAVTRDPAKLADLAAQGVEVRQGDLSDAGSLAKAFAGADRVLIVSTDTAPGSGQRIRQHSAAVAAAKAAGASRVLYTSLPKPDVSVISFAFEHLGSEKALVESGLAYTIFRNGWYAENLFMSLPQALKSGQWFTSAGDGKLTYAPRDDFAAAIAGGLASDEPGNRIHTLTGQQLFTTAEVAALASKILGKPIAVVQVSDEQLAEGLRRHGLPEPVVAMIVSIDANTRGGFLDLVTPDIETLSGRKAQSLQSFLEANKAALLA